MFWDRVAWVYDVFANGINRRANRAMCAAVAAHIGPEDEVLECACGTGLLTGVIAARCRALTATDFSEKMLAQAERKYANCRNVRFAQADITKLDYPDGRFDAVVAANVIHLLDEPLQALRELDREKKPYIFVGLVCVRQAYQGQGYMRRVMEMAFAEGDRLGIPVILETDARSKCDKYLHLGMELAGTRRFGTHGLLYDLIRYPETK